MRASLILSSALISNGFAELLQPSPSTSDPTITPAPDVPIELLRKQNDDRFMGWVSFRGTWTSRQCDLGGTYYQSGSYWRCCATTVAGCNVPVGCVGGSLVYSLAASLASGTDTDTTIACTSIYSDPTDSSFTVCNTGFLFENSADSSPQTNIFCGISSLNWSYFRVKPEETTSTPESSTRTSTRPSPITTTTGPPGPTDTVVDDGGKKKASKAWIAGAVVGPIAGLALVGFALFFCLKRKKNQAQPQGAPSPAQAQYPPQAQQSYPNSPAAPPGYYAPQMQQNPQAGMVPFGVAKHESWAPPPQSPTTQASTSPHPPQSPMYGPPPGSQQQWQPQPQQPQMQPQMQPQIQHEQPGLMPSPQQGYPQNSPPMSPQPQPQYKYEMPTANELDSSHSRPH